ncbi:MAG TPA: hypothetical protein VFB62_09095 [Polyangiaceae bacterium]|nr:hypothetical protein [Polyangiaceae bacterium]
MSHPAIFSYGTVKGIALLLLGKVDAEMSGPVAIVRESQHAGERSFVEWLEQTAARVSFYGLPLACLMAFIVRARRQAPA